MGYFRLFYLGFLFLGRRDPVDLVDIFQVGLKRLGARSQALSRTRLLPGGPATGPKILIIGSSVIR